MEKILNDVVYNKVKEYIQNDKETYTFEKLLDEKGLLKDANRKGDTVTIACPFHVDESPSCGVHLTNKIFNCFSCGRGGNYLRFLQLYKNEIENNKIGMYALVNNLLVQDKIMQSRVGANTIWKTANPIEMNSFKIRRPKLSEASTQTILEYARELKKSKPEDFEIIEFVAKMQAGYTVEQLKSTKTSNAEDEELIYKDTKGISLKDLL